MSFLEKSAFLAQNSLGSWLDEQQMAREYDKSWLVAGRGAPNLPLEGVT